MSKIEVDQVDPQSGTTLTLGTSGDTVNIPSGVTITNNGTANTGGGGGGNYGAPGSPGCNGAAGGSGIVLIRYKFQNQVNYE